MYRSHPNLLRAIFRKPDLHHGRERFIRHLDAIWIITVQQHHSILRHDPEQMPKAGFDLIEIAKDVGVVELDVVHDQQLGQVMQELGALVEKGGVVFIAFDDENFESVKCAPCPRFLGMPPIM